MKLELQVCSLPLAQRLQEFGVKQESLFKWERSCSNGLEGWNVIYAPKAKEHVFAAFTVAELGEIMSSVRYRSGCTANGDFIAYIHDNNDFHGRREDTEADARAKMLIYLLENNLSEI